MQENDSSEAKKAPAKRYHIVPALLATCKTVYAEAAPMFYGQPIIVSDTYTLQVFLSQIGPRAVGSLQDLCVNAWCRSRSHKAINLPAFSLLRDAMALRRIFIQCPHNYYHYRWRYNNDASESQSDQQIKYGITIAKQIYRAMYPFLEAFINKRGQEAVAEVLEISRPQFSVTDEALDIFNEAMIEEILKLVRMRP
jgi:hypothetical protein